MESVTIIFGLGVFFGIVLLAAFFIFLANAAN